MLYIDNSETLTPLIWGDFVNDILRINGSLNVNDAYTFPTTDGTINQVLSTNGSGTLTWVPPAKLFNKSEELKLLKTTVKDQQKQIEKLIKENKIFEERLKALEKSINE